MEKLRTFEHETPVSFLEKELPNYGYLVNRGEKCTVRVLAFDNEELIWTLEMNDISNMKVRRVLEIINGYCNLAILWNKDEQREKPPDIPKREYPVGFSKYARGVSITK